MTWKNMIPCKMKKSRLPNHIQRIIISSLKNISRVNAYTGYFGVIGFSGGLVFFIILSLIHILNCMQWFYIITL